MLITNLLVAGSVAYAGVKTVVTHHAPVKAARSTVKDGAVIMNATPTVQIEDDRKVQDGLTLAERRQRAVAATSFWLAIGGLWFPPLTIASVPLTLYSTIPILEAGCRSLYSEGRLKPSVVNSILLVSTLVSEHYLPAATIAWLHHTFRHVGRQAQAVGEQMSTEASNELVELVRQAMGGAPRAVWVIRDTIEVKVPFSDVKVGDIIVVSRGEFIPVAGVVTGGAAKVNLLLLTRSPAPVAVSIGDMVYATTFVTEGRLLVRVEKLPTAEV